MLWSNVLLAAAISLRAATPAPEPTLYRIELAGNQAVWSQDRPRDAGSLLLFHRYPGGLLVSVKKADVRRVTATRRGPELPRGLRRGGEIVLGPTGGGAGASGAEAASAGSTGASPSPGERKDGTALLNPDRQYRPDWDSKLVPGSTLPYPAAPNDYREGRAFAFPPGSATQTAPGEPPQMPPSSGEVPKGPSQ